MELNLKEDPNNIFFRCVQDCNEAIMISDMRGTLVYVNPAWERIYGYSKEEALGENPRILHSGHHSAEFYAEMWRKISDPGNGHWSGEVINRAKDGKLVPVLLTITPYRDQAGDLIGYMGIALDISHRKELEAKVVHQDRLASIGLLASGLAHEVGTPLGVIRGRAEFLQMQAKDKTSSKNLDVIISQIDRISKLIRSLLRIGRSFSDVRIEPVELRTTVNEVLLLIGQNLREDMAEVRVNVPEGLAVQADVGRLEQILLNLLINAIHAIRRAIQDGRTQSHCLTIESRELDDRVAIDVKDTGCGIPRGNMKKIFQPFFTTKDIGEGTGLGLAIVGQLLREMNGEISVQSVVNQGTTFSILLKK